MRAPAGLAAALAVASLGPVARADDEWGAALDAPAPPTLPALAHRAPTYTFELTAASINPGAATNRAYAWFVHNDLEVPLAPRKWYFGLANDAAAGSVPGLGHDFYFGNPELWLRGVWSNLLGLSSGGGLGVVVPAPQSISAAGQQVLGVVRVVRPWDAAYFTNLTATFRPWFDIRVIAGRFILQLRQGLDWSVVARVLQPAEHRTDLAARATFYAGYRLAQPIGLGVEVWEVYPITADLPDGNRATLALSPSVRFMLGRVEPELSALLPVPFSTPLGGQAASYVAGRLSVAFTFEPHGEK